jgi:hypothetical protein
MINQTLQCGKYGRGLRGLLLAVAPLETVQKLYKHNKVSYRLKVITV